MSIQRYKQDAERVTGRSDEARAEEDRVLVCARCQHPITREEARVEIAGRHRHTCVNPAGFVYRIACFREAGGCCPDGDRSDFYSWFAGCSWQINVCAGCRTQLGWSFDGAEVFFGLIEERLTSS